MQKGRTYILFTILFLLLSRPLLASDEHAATIERLRRSTHPLVVSSARSGMMNEYSLWARELSERGERLQAVEVYKTALEDTFLTSTQHDMLALNLSAEYVKLSMFDHAEDILSSHPISLDTTTTQSYQQSIRWQLRLAEVLTYKKEKEEALRIFNMLDSLNLSDVLRQEIYANKGYLLYSMNRAQEARQMLQMAYSLQTDQHDRFATLSNIALIEATLGDFNNATEHIDSAIKMAEQMHGKEHVDYNICIRKRAEIMLRKHDFDAAAKDFTTYWQAEREYITYHFGNLTTQQRLDYWANRKPLVSTIFALENHSVQAVADAAIFRRQASQLGLRDTTPQQITDKLRYKATDVRKSLKENEVAIEIIKYKTGGEYYYGAIIMPHLGADSVRFYRLFKEKDLHDYPIGGKTLKTAVCAADKWDKNMVYQSHSLSEYIFKDLKDVCTNKTVYFAADGIFNMLAIEYLPTAIDGGYDLRRLSSTALLAERQKHAIKQVPNSLSALLIGGLDYDYMEADFTVNIGADTNNDIYKQSGLRYWVSQRHSFANFTYLPGTQMEIDSISSLLNVWEKTNYETEEQLKAEISDYNILHLSTHGYSLDVSVADKDEFSADSIRTDNSLLGSGIALSGANIAYRYFGHEDGLLTAREICDIDLSHAQLVVLSACQSAQGKVSDEGTVGLVRGLKMAGAGAVIASLFPVDDQATTMLMINFYRYWNNGRGIDNKGCTMRQALHLAQEATRDYEVCHTASSRHFNAARMTSERKKADIRCKKPYREPYFWVPFILIDDLQ